MSLPATITQPMAVAEPHEVDGEWISRESRLQILEHAAVEARNSYVRSTLDLGRVLAEHRRLCEDREERFVDLLDRLGLTRTTGYRLIRTADVVAQLPSLKDLAERQYSHAVTLIEGTTEEQLQHIVSGDQPELALDDVARMPISKLRRELRKHREEVSRIIAEETRTLRSERDALAEDLESARAALGSDLRTARKTGRKVREQALALADLCETFADQILALEPADAARARGEIEGAISTASIRLKGLWETWQERALSAGLDD